LIKYFARVIESKLLYGLDSRLEYSAQPYRWARFTTGRGIACADEELNQRNAGCEWKWELRLITHRPTDSKSRTHGARPRTQRLRSYQWS